MILVDWENCNCGRCETRTGNAMVDGVSVRIILFNAAGVVSTQGMPGGDFSQAPAAEFIDKTGIVLG